MSFHLRQIAYQNLSEINGVLSLGENNYLQPYQITFQEQSFLKQSNCLHLFLGSVIALVHTFLFLWSTSVKMIPMSTILTLSFRCTKSSEPKKKSSDLSKIIRSDWLSTLQHLTLITLVTATS